MPSVGGIIFVAEAQYCDTASGFIAPAHSPGHLFAAQACNLRVLGAHARTNDLDVRLLTIPAGSPGGLPQPQEPGWTIGQTQQSAEG